MIKETKEITKESLLQIIKDKDLKIRQTILFVSNKGMDIDKVERVCYSKDAGASGLNEFKFIAEMNEFQEGEWLVLDFKEVLVLATKSFK